MKYAVVNENNDVIFSGDYKDCCNFMSATEEWWQYDLREATYVNETQIILGDLVSWETNP